MSKPAQQVGSELRLLGDQDRQLGELTVVVPLLM